MPGVADADTSVILGKPELGVNVDRDLASDLGVSVSDIATSLRILVAGEKVSDFDEGGQQYDVRLRALPEYTKNLELRGLLIALALELHQARRHLKRERHQIMAVSESERACL